MLRYNYFNIFLLHQFLYFKLKTKTRKIFGVQNILFAAIWIHTLVQWSVDVNCMVRKERSEWVADCASSLYRSDHVPLGCSGQHWQPLCNGAAQLQGNVTILYRLTQTIMKGFEFLFSSCFSFQIYLYEYENFQGRRMDLFGECRNLCEKGFERIGSIRVECGP